MNRLLLVVCAALVLAVPVLADNNRYLKDGQPNPAYEGELVVFKGQISRLVMGPGLHQFIKIDLPGSNAVWAGNFTKTTDPISIFVTGDEIGVMGFLEKPQTEIIAGIVDSPFYITGFCFFNFSKAAAISFSAPECAAYHDYNRAYLGLGYQQSRIRPIILSLPAGSSSQRQRKNPALNEAAAAATADGAEGGVHMDAGDSALGWV